ncbi:regulation of nuclear pre-mRNA domain-containing protein 1A isoform X1 [Camelus dromedarius]|uniref:Regulation of nuclear pre-mRNA domain-containing protein n=2 Tax=Camelus TaxID=9836 RepID=A0A8B7KB56_CAMFR|nr:regulation of nuclear pre-mRNA domain-containing protein 1A isoform X1 [Camelus ferus]XP_031294809.1 regulation of nuclear pre-mRNA domain-containing protein 1A isoform X1 [Camelus dromedarius]XP_045366791.1 regulation of nuclear pre-mRNA domain-containing protein 1A isoform X1 [Camelus bactrianus]
MSAFSEAALEKKLSELSNSQQSVQTLSLWLIHHRKHSRPIVTVWERELRKAKPNRKLTFLYLANDVIQNSKRKGPEFTKDFAPVIVEAFKHVSSETDESCKKHLGRVLSIWEERSVYENDVLEQLKQALYGDKKPRKRTYEQIKVDENENCSSLGSPSEPPQTLDLVRALQDLENAASGDAAVHQRIASLPVEVQEVSLLDKITDKESGERLSKTVEDACMLLADYNGRLAAEIDDRKQLTRMLADFLRCQKEALAEKEHKLEVLDMGVPSNDVIIISIFFLLKINIKLQSLNCLMFLKIEEKTKTLLFHFILLSHLNWLYITDYKNSIYV